MGFPIDGSQSHDVAVVPGLRVEIQQKTVPDAGDPISGVYFRVSGVSIQRLRCDPHHGAPVSMWFSVSRKWGCSDFEDCAGGVTTTNGRRFRITITKGYSCGVPGSQRAVFGATEIVPPGSCQEEARRPLSRP